MESMTHTLQQPGRAKHMADAETPLIRQSWYVAGLGTEFTGDLTERWLLGVPVLIYRDDENNLAALDNRCPHRSFPLSKGCRTGSAVTCGYHGLTFGPDGQCIRIPSQPSVPSNLAIRAYPLAERGPLVWIWMGDPAEADEALIPDYFDIQAEGWAAVSNYTSIAADYVSLHENLQDLTHFTFLHGSSIGIPQFEKVDLEVEVRGDQVLTRRESRNLPPPAFWKSTLPLQGDLIDRVITTAFKGPPLCDGTMVILDHSAAEGETRHYTAQILHFLTPETNLRTHYWWFVVRDFGIGDDETAATVREGFSSTFAEDKFALEAIAVLKLRDTRTGFVEKSFAGDRAGMKMRLSLQTMATREQR